MSVACFWNRVEPDGYEPKRRAAWSRWDDVGAWLDSLGRSGSASRQTAADPCKNWGRLLPPVRETPRLPGLAAWQRRKSESSSWLDISAEAVVLSDGVTLGGASGVYVPDDKSASVDRESFEHGKSQAVTGEFTMQLFV